MEPAAPASPRRRIIKRRVLVALCGLALVCGFVALGAALLARPLRVHVNAAAGTYTVLGVRCGVGGVSRALGLLNLFAEIDGDDCSTIEVDLTADDDASWGDVRAAMDACARRRVYRVDWRWKNVVVPAYVYKDREPAPFVFDAFGPRARIASGPPATYEVQRERYVDPRVAAGVVRRIRERSPLPVDLAMDDNVRFKDAFAFLSEVARDPRIDVVFRDLVIHTKALEHCPYNRGVRDAKDDAARGAFRIITFGHPLGDEWRDVQTALMQERYGVVVDHRGCCIEPREDEYIEGYNTAARAAIETAHGIDVERECESLAKRIVKGELPELREKLLKDPEVSWMIEWLKPMSALTRP